MKMAIASLRQEVLAAIDESAPDLWALALDIHAHPEVAFQEYRSAEVLCAALRRYGYTVERPTAGLETAFRAEAQGIRSGPTVALLAEYDALPELGHGCGHNLICTGALGAAVGLRRVLDRVPGRVVVLGTPAEEGGGGKIILLERGAFAGVDAALMFHPSNATLAVRASLASFRLKLRFLGRAAHAAATPHEGLNALDAMVQLFVAIGLLRQQLRDDARVHGIITYGGAAPNVIPDRTEALFSVRAMDRPYAEEVLRRVVDCARGAALATGTTVEHEAVPAYEAIRPNQPLAQAFARHLESLGWPQDTQPERPRMGSTDMGNVSHALPAIHPYVRIGSRELRGHSPEFREAAASEEGRRAMLAAAKALALTALDVLVDPGFLAEVRRDFASAASSASSSGR